LSRFEFKFAMLYQEGAISGRSELRLIVSNFRFFNVVNQQCGRLPHSARSTAGTAHGVGWDFSYNISQYSNRFMQYTLPEIKNTDELAQPLSMTDATTTAPSKQPQLSQTA
jgi:hypothetical protein